jgi:hypothetical protein
LVRERSLKILLRNSGERRNNSESAFESICKRVLRSFDKLIPCGEMFGIFLEYF